MNFSVFLFLFLSFNRCNSQTAVAIFRVELGGGGVMGGSNKGGAMRRSVGGGAM